MIGLPPGLTGLKSLILAVVAFLKWMAWLLSKL
jgi:hypothetical protein